MILKGKFSRFGALCSIATRFPVAARCRFPGDGYTNLASPVEPSDLVINPDGINYAFNITPGGWFGLKNKNALTECFNLEASEIRPLIDRDDAIISMTLDTSINYPASVATVGYAWEFTSDRYFRLKDTVEARYHTIYAYNGDLVLSEDFFLDGLLSPPVPGLGINYKFYNRIFYIKDYLTGEWKVPYGVMTDGVMSIELT